MDSIHIKGYKRLQDVRLKDLSQINYLVGGNASGKSSVLEVLKVVGEGLQAPPTSATFTVRGFSKHSIDSKEGFEVLLGAGGRLDLGMKLGSEVPVSPEGSIQNGLDPYFVRDKAANLTKRLSEVGTDFNRLKAATNAHLLRKSGFGIRTTLLSTRYPENNEHSVTPERAWLNLDNIDDALKEPLLTFLNTHHAHVSGKKFVDIARAMQEDTAILLKVAEMGKDQKGGFYYHETATEHPMMALSDGMRALLGLFYGIEKRLRDERDESGVVRIVCIDEPEHGLHPDKQKKVAEILNNFAITYPNVMFFVTTHSPFIISRAAKFNDKKHKIYLLNKGQLNNLLGQSVVQSSGFYGENCLNVVAKMLGAGFGDLNAAPATSESLTVVYCEGESKETKDSQLYKRIFRDENVVFVSAKDFFAAVVAFRIGEQAASFVFGDTTSVRVLVDRSFGCPKCKLSNNGDHSSHPQEFSIGSGLNIKYTHMGRVIFDNDEVDLIETTDKNDRLRVLTRKEPENYLFDPAVVALISPSDRAQLHIPNDVDYMNGEVKDRIGGKSPKIYKALADAIYEHKASETKSIYDELAGYIGLT